MSAPSTLGQTVEYGAKRAASATPQRRFVLPMKMISMLASECNAMRSVTDGPVLTGTSDAADLTSAAALAAELPGNGMTSASYDGGQGWN